ncbi:class I SAM-dependent methyltransferase [Thalassobaculum sp.]|jgi:cyclopropane-fatty-acyl-phospholipid synthase|uniref:class I SAM-dependent methyltransferase n=1 Tax=Thalassobaculum sp. TaxID=2022740 RepID=UPI003B59F0E1
MSDTTVSTPLAQFDLSGLDAWTRRGMSLLTRLAVGRLTVQFPDGRQLTFEGREPGPSATVRLKDTGVVRRFMMGGDLGFAEAFIEDEAESPDLTALVELFCRNKAAIQHHTRAHPLAKLLRRALHLLNRNSRSGARRNISYHYDLGNAFYERWLDPTMTYSAALFDGSQQDLEAAQNAKYHRLARDLDLKPGQRVLEIGCGWGGFAEVAARDYGAHVHGITLSTEQLAYARDRAEAAGLSDRVTFELCDYRDVRGSYDAVASIEMFEAVGEKYWPAFFGTVKDRLKPGGKAALQIITIDPDSFDDYRRNPDFIQRYIFPGGMLPTRSHVIDHAAQVGLTPQDERGFGLDYARTLAEWRDRFLASWPQIADLGFDDRFKRMWLYYLAYCEGGFRSGNIDVRHFAFQRG